MSIVLVISMAKLSKCLY